MDVPFTLVALRRRLSALTGLVRRHTALLLGLLVGALGLALRLYRLGAQSLWLDEGSTWAEVTGRTGKGWLALLGELFSKDAAYPLYHVLLKAWVSRVGDAEWALRFPSALAGAAAVLVMYVAASELAFPNSHDEQRKPIGAMVERHGHRPLAAALLFATSPFALWYAQDAKVYSLLMLAVALELWALLRALRRDEKRAWLLLIAASVVCLFVHRLALLVLAGVALVCCATGRPGRHATHIRRSYGVRGGFGLLALGLAAAGIAGTILAVRDESRSAGGHIPAGPVEALWLTWTRFSLDRWPGDIDGYRGLPLLVWLLPGAALTLWGLALLLRDGLARRPAAIAILAMLGVPLALLALALIAVPVYEARYATVAFPAWFLALAYPFTEPRTDTRRVNQAPRRWLARARLLLLGALLLVNALVLLQPHKGLFSGDAVKEQWREAVTYLARRAHPDDLVMLHPYYVAPLYDYYAPRVTPDPLPQVVTFPVFAGGACLHTSADRLQQLDCIRRNYNDPYFNQKAYGKKRALLLIAPDHARIVDPPPTAHDAYGWVGLRFQFSGAQRAWPCGGSGDQFIGVEVMCQSYPATFNAGGAGAIPQPAVPLDATFGGELHLRGYRLALHGDMARAGGTLPITLYWDAAAKPTHDYQLFLHLCRDCAIPPLAHDDGPPLNGYFPAGRTTTWQIGDPVHDERTVYLPDTLPPGHYTLLLGVYPALDPSERARLPVSSLGGRVLDGTRLVLGEVAIMRPGS